VGFWSGIAGLFGADFFKSGKKKEDPYAKLLAGLQPYLDSNKKISEQTTAAGLASTGAAQSDYDFVNKYLKDILTGSDDNILKLFDSAGLTQNIDENEQQIAQQGVRGGRNAASLAMGYFNRDAAINKVLQQIRFAAPNQIANIAQAMGNLGLGEFSAAQGSGAQASNILFGIEGLKQQDADRRNQLIGSIFQAIGGAAGLIAGGA